MPGSTPGWRGSARGRWRRACRPATFDAAFAQAGFLPGVIERDRNQTEFTRTLEDYLAIAASDERVSQGAGGAGAARARRSAAIEGRYGVEPEVVTAVWGMESFYGERRGSVPVVSALATLAYEGRRASFFESQLVAALKILQNGDVTPAGMTGSWAGAMGHTQFIPTSLPRLCGRLRRRRAAGHLVGRSDRRAGLDGGLSRAVGLAAGAALGGRGAAAGRASPGRSGAGRRGARRPGRRRGCATWTGGRCRTTGPASIIAPMGRAGPAFMVFPNFAVIGRYNNAENYMIGIGHLSDRLKGGPPVRGSFPPDARGMTIADRRALQERLTARGFDTGGADGVIGKRTTDAIAGYQASAGLPVTGEPSLELLASLR